MVAANLTPLGVPGIDAFPPGRWRARWIWAPRPDGTDASGRHVVALRTTVELDSVPPSVPARLLTVARHTLRVNGVEVARGPVRSNPRRQPCDALDLAPHLRSGTNVISVIAWIYEGATPWWLPPPVFSNDLVHGGFVMEADLGDGAWLTTGDAWTGRVLDGWGSAPMVGISGRGIEHIDLRSLPAGWDTATAPPADFAPVKVRRAHTSGEAGYPEPPTFPYGPIGHRPITWPSAEVVALRPSAEDPNVLTVERAIVGVLRVDAEIPAGATLEVRVAELLDAEGRPNPTEHDSGAAITGDGTRRIAETVDLYGLRGALLTVPEGATVHSVEIIERLHPTGDAGSGGGFECSDDDLNTIYAVGRRTVSLCSMDAYLDCPTREQRAWTGDSVVHQMVDLATSGDWTLARWHPRLAASPRADGMLAMAVAGEIELHDFTIIPDWALHWVRAVWNLHRYVGDVDEIRDLLGVVEGVVRWFVPFQGPDGLLNEVPGWVILDWASVPNDGKSATLNGLWARALNDFADLADFVGDAGRAAWARRLHAKVVAGFEAFWDEDRGRYADSIALDPDGPDRPGGVYVRRPQASQHGQAAALVGALVPRDRIHRVVEVITDRTHHVDAAYSVPDGPATPNSEVMVGGPYLRQGQPQPWWDVDTLVVRAQPFFRYVVHDALAIAGRSDLIAGQCLDWTTALERCATSFTETWYGGTVTHGWSSTPTRDLIVRVLGITPGAPGFTAALVEPALGHLTWARGSAPTPFGPITVSVTPEVIEIDSPVPVRHRTTLLAAGVHRIDRRELVDGAASVAT